MNCEYLERSNKIGSCVFSYNCMEECFYKYKHDSEFVDELCDKINSLENELWEADAYQQDIDDIKQELEETEGYKSNLLDLCKELVIQSNLPKEELEELVNSSCLEWEDLKELDKIIKEKEDGNS